MTSTRRQAEEFHAALDHGTSSVTSEIDLFLECADSLRVSAATIAPSAHFTSALRESLMAQAAEALAPVSSAAASGTAAARPRSRRFGKNVAIVATIAIGTVGLVATSAQAVPGDMLYGVKRAVESIELHFRQSDSSRGSLQLTQASERLAETEELLADGNTGHAVEALKDFRAQADAGATSMFAAYQDSSDDKVIDQVAAFAEASANSLAFMTEFLDSEGAASEAVSNAMDTVQSITTQAERLCTACSPITLPDLSDLFTFPDLTLTTPQADTEKTESASSTSPSSQPSATSAAPTAQAPGGAPASSAPSAPSTATGPQSAPATTPPAAAPTPAAPAPPTNPIPANPPAPAPPAAVEIPILTPLVEKVLGKDGIVPNLLDGVFGTPEQ